MSTTTATAASIPNLFTFHTSMFNDWRIVHFAFIVFIALIIESFSHYSLNLVAVQPYVDPYLAIPIAVDPYVFQFDRRFRRGRRIPNKPPKNYTHKDQDNWPLTFPLCNSSQQSPINILSYGVESDPTMFLEFGPFYNTWLQKAELSNDGVTVEIELTGGGSPLVSGTAVNNELYRFQQFHFHWGSEDNVGSEHTIDNVRFPLEMHLVHYNDKYDNIIEAATKPDGLLVLAILFKLSVVNNPFLNPLIIDLGSVRCSSRKLDFNNRVILAQLLPVNTRFFYQYRGSLTTPPCLETVNWIIFPETVPIGIAQMLQFRLLSADKDCRTVIGDNWRRTQATNSRVVKKPLRGIW